jgi:hypothetical protein
MLVGDQEIPVRVYGFGSYFMYGTGSRDVDLLIIHSALDIASCRFAIRCKRLLSASINYGDFTVLSETEEAELRFLSRSHCIALGEVWPHSVEQDTAKICGIIGERAFEWRQHSRTV